jgi:hypothetical protein
VRHEARTTAAHHAAATGDGIRPWRCNRRARGAKAATVAQRAKIAGAACIVCLQTTTTSSEPSRGRSSGRGAPATRQPSARPSPPGEGRAADALSIVAAWMVFVATVAIGILLNVT